MDVPTVGTGPGHPPAGSEFLQHLQGVRSGMSHAVSRGMKAFWVFMVAILVPAAASAQQCKEEAPDPTAGLLSSLRDVLPCPDPGRESEQRYIEHLTREIVRFEKDRDESRMLLALGTYEKKALSSAIEDAFAARIAADEAPGDARLAKDYSVKLSEVSYWRRLAQEKNDQLTKEIPRLDAKIVEYHLILDARRRLLDDMQPIQCSAQGPKGSDG